MQLKCKHSEVKEQKAKHSEPVSNQPRSQMTTKKATSTVQKKKQLQKWKTNHEAMGNKSRKLGRHEDQETDAQKQKNWPRVWENTKK